MIRLLLTTILATTGLNAVAPYIVHAGDFTVILDESRYPDPRSGARDFDAVVSIDGSGTHATIQDAINGAPTDTTVEKQFRILVKQGVYKEHVVIPANKKYIQLKGEPGVAKATVITMGTNVKTPDPANPGKTLSAQDSSTVFIDASDITCRDITFENKTKREDKVQALACFIRGDRVSFLNCRFLGWQDTLRPDSSGRKICRQYFRDCYVEGHVDYIYAGGTALFDRCQIHTKADGYITAASTAETTPYGFVFLDCKVTTGPGVERGVYLGRPWRPFAHCAFIRCEIDGMIRPEGWHNWGKAENEKTARFFEYLSSGPGAKPSARVDWSTQLTDQEAAAFTVENILRGNDAWNPAR